MIKKIISFICLLLLCSCFGKCDSDITGRIILKSKRLTDCKIEWDFVNRNGFIVCAEDRFSFMIDDNSSWGRPTTCYVSQEDYNKYQVGELFTCVYGEKQ